MKVLLSKHKYKVIFASFLIFVSIAFLSLLPNNSTYAAVLSGADSDVGIFWYVFGGPADDTTDANDSDIAGDVSWPAGNQDSRNVYIGHLTTKFNKVFVDVSSPTTDLGVDLDMQYWNGSAWTALTLLAQTHPFDTVGVNSFSFTPPADWATTSVGGTSAYYIRTPIALGTLNEKGYVNAEVSQISLKLVTPPGVTITESGIGGTSLTETGATDGYTIVLDAQPASNVTIDVTPDSSSTVSTSSIVFTTSNWDTPVTVTVTAVDDSVAQGSHSSTITHSATSDDADYNGFGINSVVATVSDNDTAGVTLSDASAQTAATEGGSTGYLTAVLTSSPTSTVTLTLTPSSQITLSTSTIEFSSANWNVPVTSTITAVDDTSVEGTHSATITYSVESSNWNYSGLVLTNTSVSITDNDSAAAEQTSNNNSAVSTPPAPPVLTLPAEVSDPSDTQSSSPIITGAPLEFVIEPNKPVSVPVGSENHTVTQVGIASATQITVVIQSEPITLTLLRDTPQEIDVNDDGKVDLRILYKGLVDGKPEMSIVALTPDAEKRKPLSINSGEAITQNPLVTLTLRAQNVTLMAISEDKTFASGSFVPFASTAEWKLSPGEGEKTVYVRLRSPAGGTVDISDTIVYQPKDTLKEVPSPKKQENIVPQQDKMVEKSEKTYFTKPLSFGSFGKDVKELQTLLKRLGYFQGSSLSGIFGWRTESAVQAFQKDHGIAPVGYVGPLTRKALNSVE